MARKTIFTLLGVVFHVAPFIANFHQSGASDVNEQPIDALRNIAETKEIAAPEVVLQLKYEQGELNRIYLTQFRKDVIPKVPAVPAPFALCADLCHAGLGGKACGDSCTDMIPVALATALRSENQSTTQFGTPRAHVCPALCANNLGSPLCKCQADMDKEEAVVADWDTVCAAFCSNDGYVLEGCPPCKEETITSVPVQLANMRTLSTSEGWITWCNVQCRQGQGGAACNCDRTPFQ